MRGFIVAGDERIMHRVHRWRPPRWFRLWMVCATRGGDGWLWYAMAAVILLFGGPQRFAAVGASALAVSIGIVFFLAVKRKARRRRPCHLEPHCWYKLLPPDQFSFPSGHTITAFAVTVPVAVFYPDLRIGLIFCAASVAVSRIILGMHFLSDVLAGAAIGSGLGYAAAHLLGA